MTCQHQQSALTHITRQSSVYSSPLAAPAALVPQSQDISWSTETRAFTTRKICTQQHTHNTGRLPGSKKTLLPGPAGLPRDAGSSVCSALWPNCHTACPRPCAVGVAQNDCACVLRDYTNNQPKKDYRASQVLWHSRQPCRHHTRPPSLLSSSSSVQCPAVAATTNNTPTGPLLDSPHTRTTKHQPLRHTRNRRGLPKSTAGGPLSQATGLRSRRLYCQPCPYCTALLPVHRHG